MTTNYRHPAIGEPVHAGLSAEQADGVACVTCARPLPGGAFAGRSRLDVGRSAETGSVVFACPGVCADLATTPAADPIPLVPTERRAA